MLKTLRILSSAIMLSLLFLLALEETHPFNIEATIPSTEGGSFAWTPRSSGRCFLYLHYDAESLPNEVKTNFLNWKNPPQTNWEAQLHVVSGGNPLMSEKVLKLDPAIQSGQDFYFLIGHFEMKKDVRLTISLRPRQQLPFDGAVPRLTICSSSLEFKAYPFRHLLWRTARFLCVPVLIAILADYLYLAAVCKRQPVTPSK